ADIEFPEFWNPKLRAPICFNPPAVRSYLPRQIKRTQLVLAGSSKTQMFDALKASIDKKELPPLESGALGYMLSKQGYLNDDVGHWHPHIMLFLPQTDPATWGADLPNSPILSLKDVAEGVTMILVPVRRWSDGTPDS